MKKFLLVALLAVGLLSVSQQRASAWGNNGFRFSCSFSCQWDFPLLNCLLRCCTPPCCWTNSAAGYFPYAVGPAPIYHPVPLDYGHSPSGAGHPAPGGDSGRSPETQARGYGNHIYQPVNYYAPAPNYYYPGYSAPQDYYTGYGYGGYQVPSYWYGY